MAPADSFGLVGQVLDGHFRVEQSVGEGGFSVVYKGTHIGLSEPIAIKCLKLPPALGSAVVESFVKRFRDESRLQYRLSQGNLDIVRSIASGTTMAPATSALVPYTVFEWLEGRSLADELDERTRRRMGGRSLAEVVRLLDSAVLALAHAHAQGVVHRDLNPGNFFLARTGTGTRLKVLDFGVAKVLADSALEIGPSARTIGNLRMFAPAYGAPEQFDERVGPIGAWTDVYSLAIVALEALRDAPVVTGEHLGEFAMQALDPMRRPTPRRLGIAVGDEVEAAFVLALSLDPTKRPHDAGAFWGLLKHAVRVDADSGKPLHAEPAPDAFGGHTLRMNERSRSAPSPADTIDDSEGDSPDAFGLGGTLRVEPDAATSAAAHVRSAVLAAARAGREAPDAPSWPPAAPGEPIPPPPGSWSRARLAWVVALVGMGLAAGGLLAWSAGQARVAHAPAAAP